ncbi:MAG: flagellar hook assembly protein FlgD [Methylococcaceae bacterium]|nr:flagellar hook assembly protein FlgD [Methylococcaceae bacterium]
MSTVNPYSGLGVATLDAASTAKKTSLGQADFLKLMTTQLTHQDPTKPMQNGEFLSQMAQFGTVSGIQDLQQAFKDFSTSISSGQTLQAASLVGRSVSSPSNSALLESGGDIKGSIDLPESASNVNVKIMDAGTGDVVKSLNLGGPHRAGSVTFDWDGLKDNNVPAAPGTYKVQVNANMGGVNTELTPNIESRVESVSIGSGSNGIQVNLKGLNSINFNQVKQIL